MTYGYYLWCIVAYYCEELLDIGRITCYTDTTAADIAEQKKGQ